MIKERNDIVGKKFGMLTVLERVNHKCNKRHNYYYKCKCDCGNIKDMLKWCITNPKTKGCGCQRSKTGKNHFGFVGYEGIHGNTWTMIKKNAQTRNISFEITIEYAWDLYKKQNGKCALSGVPISFSKRIKGDTRSASMDRIDNSIGYVEGNVHWVHKTINFMKSTMSALEFLEWCGRIYNHKIKV